MQYKEELNKYIEILKAYLKARENDIAEVRKLVNILSVLEYGKKMEESCKLPAEFFVDAVKDIHFSREGLIIEKMGEELKDVDYVCCEIFRRDIEVRYTKNGENKQIRIVDMFRSFEEEYFNFHSLVISALNMEYFLPKLKERIEQLIHRYFADIEEKVLTEEIENTVLEQKMKEASKNAGGDN